MCVPVCMFVLTRTVLLPSRGCVVMSVTSTEANCGQVGIRSPQGCVRSTSRVMRGVARSVRPVLPAELENDPGGERQVDGVGEGDGPIDLLEVEEALHGSLDVLLRDPFVLRPGLPALERLARRFHDITVGLWLPH